MEVNDKKELLYEVELRVATLIKRYQRLKEKVSSLESERDQLLQERNALEERVGTLEQKLSVVALSIKDDPDAQSALSQLRGEISDMISAVDDCIALLDTRLGND